MLARTYLIYCLTLLSAALLYFGFAAMSAVAAGIGWVPTVSWLASLVHFGISSWLFLWVGKSGRLLALFTALIICLWPLAAISQFIIHPASGNYAATPSLAFLLPVLSSGLVSYWHLKDFHQHPAVPGRVARLLLSAPPLGIFVYIAYFYF